MQGYNRAKQFFYQTDYLMLMKINLDFSGSTPPPPDD